MKANRFRFRAWRESDKHMLLNQMVGVTSKDKVAVYSADNGICANYDILMQSTGLTDKRGREIFEGDIVEWDGSNGHWKSERMAVTWDGYGWEIIRKHWALENVSVIGNIYQNPELLKG